MAKTRCMQIGIYISKNASWACAICGIVLFQQGHYTNWIRIRNWNAAVWQKSVRHDLRMRLKVNPVNTNVFFCVFVVVFIISILKLRRTYSPIMSLAIFPSVRNSATRCAAAANSSSVRWRGTSTCQPGRPASSCTANSPLLLSGSCVGSKYDRHSRHMCSYLGGSLPRISHVTTCFFLQLIS